jgi:lysozyme family protein
MPVNFTESLKQEYQHLFDTCRIRPARAATVLSLVNKIVSNRSRYEAVGNPLGVPWHFVGIIHNMEASLNFKTHLHNGDPLTARTVHVPAGRPKQGNPPFTWEDSAADALSLENLGSPAGWSIPATLYKMERYNGFGYRLRHPEVLSPYLWSFTEHYTSGKFVADGTFSRTAVSAQCGGAALLRRMAELNIITFDKNNEPLPATAPGGVDAIGPLVQFSNTKRSDLGLELQKALNKFPGIFVKEDGVPGDKTSDAFKRVTGHFLAGDPRGA